METYAKTLGQVAVGVVIVGVGILAIAAVAESGGAGLGSLPIGGSSKSKKDEKGQKIPLLLCRECVAVLRKKNEKRKRRSKN